jgi:endonuclease YncB( thermonuclease family)
MGICSSTLITTDLTTPKYSFEDTWFIGKCVSVYDGDTITITAFLCDGTNSKLEPRQIRIRCYGYDSPEMKPSLTAPNRDQIIRNAIKAKEYVEKRILNKLVVFHCKGFDKYGRFLGDIYYSNHPTLDVSCTGCLPKFVDKNWVRDNELLYLNKEMVDGGYGKEYFGGTKE